MHITIFYDTSMQISLTSFFNTHLLSTFSDSASITLHAIDKNDFKPCLGCFGCWIKTPGKCVIKTDMIEKTTDALINSDLVVITSPILYGCYSTSIKRILDRSIPSILPFFRVHKGEIHHQPRYKKLAPQLIIGYNADITPSEKATFRNLVQANATNFNISDPTVYICSNEDEIVDTLSQVKLEISHLERSLS